MGRLILLNGAPGSGKTTVAALLHEALGAPWFEFGWIPEFRRLNPHTEISYEEEEQISFENLTLVARNYLNHGFAYVILSDLSDERMAELASRFADADPLTVTLYCGEETMRHRILTRDNGNEYRDTEAAARIRAAILGREPIPGEVRIDSGRLTPEEIRDAVLRYLTNEQI